MARIGAALAVAVAVQGGVRIAHFNTDQQFDRSAAVSARAAGGWKVRVSPNLSGHGAKLAKIMILLVVSGASPISSLLRVK
ncbi:hypothetical protein [uncultured Thiodictyon sp.]|uniref:hypothetical protein n=1 Tax=uncultured Thiodictyon sp. TaxID=1846217 RepID=UPI0025FE3C6A|nr:hypothetical protein [uncultured Thiodictyon sp.]